MGCLGNLLEGCIKTYAVARKQGDEVYDLHVTTAHVHQQEVTAKALRSHAPSPSLGYSSLVLYH